MGNCISARNESMQFRLSVSDFTFIRLLGKGSSGCVWKVSQDKTQTSYALKIMDKVKILSNKYVKTAMAQRQLLTHLNSIETDYIVKMKGSFQDKNKLYLLMDLIQGQNLRQYINEGLELSQDQIKYLVRCLIQALEYLYASNIIHRDLKPENIIVNHEGKPFLTDFGISSFAQKENSQFCAGSIGYMAPELIAYNNHTFSVDYFSLGIIVFQLFFRKRPYISHTKQEFLKQLTKKPMNHHNFPELNKISLHASDFITKLLQKKTHKRLGSSKGIIELKEHTWMQKISEHQSALQAKWARPVKSDENPMNKKKPIEVAYNQRQSKYYKILHQGHLQQLFKGYDYLPTSDNSQMSSSANRTSRRLSLYLSP